MPSWQKVFCVGWLLAGLGPLWAQTGAYELLEATRQAYDHRELYSDHGRIEVVDPAGRRQWRFKTLRTADVFRLLVEDPEDPEGFHRLLSREQSVVRLDDVVLGQYRLLGSLGEGLVEILGHRDFEALVVAAMVAGSRAALPRPEAAALEGTEPCPQSAATCHLLSLSRLKGDHETLLWIDRDSHLIRRLEIVVHPGDALRRALSEAGLDRKSPALEAPTGPRTYYISHEIGSAPELAELVSPASARQVETWQPPFEEPELRNTGSDTVPTLVFEDTVSVELFRITTRVVDTKGSPVLGLRPEDFQVSLGRDEVPVASVEWVSSDPAFRDLQLEAELAREGIELEPPEKLVVVFVQAGLHATRIKGHLRTLPFFQDFLAKLQPNDRVAVVSFDSHLKLWLDFTRRHAEVSEALSEAILFGGDARLARRGSAEASLERHFDFRAAKSASSPEQALEVVGRALEKVAGEKVMVYLGWGMGRFGRGGVTMTGDYAPAVSALLRAKTSVFVLDVTDAGYHSLEIGLRNVAAQTGGTYAKTSLFARQVTDRLANTLTGHYELMFSTGDLPAEHGVLRIKLRERKGRVVSDTFRVERQ